MATFKRWDGNIKDLECPICPKKIGSYFNIHRHLKTLHKNAKVVHRDVQNFKDSVDATQFEEKNAVATLYCQVNSAASIHRKVNFDIECRNCINQIGCSILFKNKSELKQQIQLNHNNEPKKLMFCCSFDASLKHIEEEVCIFEDSVDATHFEEKMLFLKSFQDY